MTKVINCAHRGAMAYEPENTLRAFGRAADMGADQIELDVFLSADGVPVISHGPRLHTEPRGGFVRRMSLDEIRQLRFHGEPVPTLQEALDLCNERGMMINIEIKDTGAIGKTVELIRKNNFHDRCQVSCFFISALRKVKSIDSRVPTGYLALPFTHRMQMRMAAAAGCESINPLHKQVSKAFVRVTHARGLKIIVWTVNEPDDMRRVIKLGVDGIITNKPDVLTQVKRDMGVE